MVLDLKDADKLYHWRADVDGSISFLVKLGGNCRHPAPRFYWLYPKSSITIEVYTVEFFKK